MIVLALAAFGSFAQSVSGDLAGTIYDASGATIPNATIVGKNDATGIENHHEIYAPLASITSATCRREPIRLR
jgi:hypothetical protein